MGSNSTSAVQYYTREGAFGGYLCLLDNTFARVAPRARFFSEPAKPELHSTHARQEARRTTTRRRERTINIASNIRKQKCPAHKTALAAPADHLQARPLHRRIVATTRLWREARRKKPAHITRSRRRAPLSCHCSRGSIDNNSPAKMPPTVWASSLAACPASCTRQPR